MLKKALLLPAILFFASVTGVMALETGNLGQLWSDYQSRASGISAKETTLRKARDGGGASEIAATKELYIAQLQSYEAYLLWVEEALALYGDEQGGTVEQVVSMGSENASASASMAGRTVETVTQKNLYLADLPVAREIIRDLYDAASQITDEVSLEEFGENYREQKAIVENLLYPIYTFTIVSRVREANFALHDYVEILEAGLPVDGGAFELNQYRQTLQNARTSLDEVSAQVGQVENTWQEITDRTTYGNFLNQVRALNGRLTQIQQSLREVGSYVESGK